MRTGADKLLLTLTTAARDDVPLQQPRRREEAAATAAAPRCVHQLHGHRGEVREERDRVTASPGRRSPRVRARSHTRLSSRGNIGSTVAAADIPTLALSKATAVQARARISLWYSLGELPPTSHDSQASD